ncbi:MAG: threonine/serine exporter family protein [Oscillospiraceae bacterium]|nr:threonine/serine exporter family protein [Oscillospiraceae bacterium]
MAEHTALLHLTVELGYRLQESGAEIYRVEEAVRRVFAAYGVEQGQVFAIPNCLIVSAIDEEGRPISRLRRIPSHGTDVTRMERVYGYCRWLCRQTPEPEPALAELEVLDREHPQWPFWAQLGGYFISTGSLGLFFGGSGLDGLAAGLCGGVAGACMLLLGRLHTNLFARTAAAAFLSALLAAVLVALGLGSHTHYIIIGGLMALVPGLMFVSFMRDIIAGDTVAGLIKLVEALLTGCAIALGTAVAMGRTGGLFG